MTTPLRLAEAGDDGTSAEAAQAARQAMAEVLRRRGVLVQDLDGELAKIIQQALARITAQLSAAPSDYQQWVLPRLAEAVQRVLDELAASAAAKTNEATRQAWELGEQVVANPIQAASAAGADAAAGLGQPALQQLRALQHMSTGLIKGATDAAVNTINRQLGQVVLGAATPFDAIKAVAKLLPDRTRSQLRGIVNTNLATAFNTAAWHKLKALADRDPALRKQWRRSGKLHSRANHDAADGQVQEIDKPFVLPAGKGRKGTVELMYPADPAAPVGEVIHCGCVALPWKAGWKLRNPGARPLTDAERKARELPARKAAPAAPAAPAAAPAAAASTPQQRALAAFAATGGRWRDVTGQTLQVDARLYPAAAVADERLKVKGSDLASYWAVQTVKRPTEVWQQERVDIGSGELLRTRRFIKRFQAGGQTWVAQADFELDGGTWVPVRAYRADPVGAGGDVAMTAARAGARVYPRR